MQRIRRFASCDWPMVLRKQGNRWKWKGESWFHYKGAFRRCSWNRRDVILFSVVRKITVSRENRRELLGGEVMKTASHRDCTLQVTLNRIWSDSTGQEKGVCFYTAKPRCWFQSRSLSSLFSAVQYKSVKYEDSQHFVSRNLWTVGTAIHQIAIITYFTNFYDTFYATPCVPLKWGNHSHITGIQSSKCSLY